MATHDIFMPALSSTMTEGKIVEWLKQPGDKVGRGESVLVVESDKADMDVESFNEGFLAAVLMPAGSTAPVGETIGLIVETEAEIAEAQAKAPGGAGAAPEATAPAQTPAPPVPAPPAPAEPVVAAPVAVAPVAAAPVAAPAPSTGGATKPLKSPLPGSIIKIITTEGQAVKRGETLLTMESMKMENEIKAEKDCIVRSIKVSEGQSVMQDDVLLDLEY